MQLRVGNGQIWRHDVGVLPEGAYPYPFFDALLLEASEVDWPVDLYHSNTAKHPYILHIGELTSRSEALSHDILDFTDALLPWRVEQEAG